LFNRLSFITRAFVSICTVIFITFALTHITTIIDLFTRVGCKHYATVRRDSRKMAVSYVSSYIGYSIPVLLQGREVESNGYQDG